MKLAKKILALAIAALTLTSFAACNNEEKKSDMEYVKEKGKLVVGITEFEPMDYKDENGNWIGFDADMAKAFAESLGCEVEFVEINWNNKIIDLNSKAIDCVWNGMTLVDEVTENASCSKPYCKNKQVVVVKADVAENYQTIEACKDLTFAVEDGSSGQDVAEESGWQFNPVDKQATAVLEVASGTSEAAIIDFLMACAMVGEGSGYPQLTYTVQFSDEQYGVAFRKGSDLAEQLNNFFKACEEDGTMATLADRYKIQEAILPQ